MVHQPLTSLSSSSSGEAEQLCLFDEVVASPTTGDDGGDAQIEALVTEILSQVPKDEQRNFLLRFRFKTLLHELERFSQREKEQFAVWLVEALLTPNDHTGGR